MDSDKVPNKFLQLPMDSDDTDTDNSALYYSAVENTSSQLDSALEADYDAMTLDFVNVDVHASSSSRNMTPDRIRDTENDLNVINKLTLDFVNVDVEKVPSVEIVNQKLEQIKLEMPMKANWRFTSPSNPAYIDPASEVVEKTKEPSPGQIQFQKTVTRVSMDYDEDLNSVPPPLTGRPSMAFDDFEQMKQLFKVKTPAKQPTVIETDTESDVTPEEVRPPKTLEQAFEKMAAGMANSSIDEIYAKEEKSATKVSQLPKRTSISTAYRKNGIPKANSVPAPTGSSHIPAVTKRATWASRTATIQLPGIPESKPTLAKKWAPSVDLATAGPSKPVLSRKSYLPMSRQPDTDPAPKVSLKKRQSLHPAALKPAVAPLPTRKPSEPEKPKPKTSATLKIANVKIGNRRSSFGKPVGKPNIRKSMLPSRASPRPTRRSVMPPPMTSSLVRTGTNQSHTGAIPKQTAGSKSNLMCKYCDKKFAIVKALDDHLLQKCPKIPPKDKKALLSQNYAARELEYSRKLPGSRSAKKVDPMDSSGSSSSAGGMMAAPRSVPKVNRSAAHSGIVHTPNKQITCMACGMRFASVVNYTIHITTEHEAQQGPPESPVPDEK